MTAPSTTDDPSTRSDTRPATIGVRLAQGVAMGVADVIPGVSGGTVALIVGIYTRLIAAIRTLSQAPILLLRGRAGEAGEFFRSVPWAFVIPVGLGLLAALGLGSEVLPPLLEAYPVQTSALFFGMIVASLAVPWVAAADDPSTSASQRIGLAAVTAVAAFLIMGLPEGAVTDDPGLLRVFLSASVAICAMILPGVSGAFLLVAMGIYEPTLEAVSDRNLTYVATFVLGAVIGLGAFSRLLSRLLDNHLGVTMAALTGLMLGALRVLWPWGGAEGRLDAPPTTSEALLALGMAVFGFAIVRLLLISGRRSTASGG